MNKRQQIDKYHLKDCSFLIATAIIAPTTFHSGPGYYEAEHLFVAPNGRSANYLESFQRCSSAPRYMIGT